MNLSSFKKVADQLTSHVASHASEFSSIFMQEEGRELAANRVNSERISVQEDPELAIKNRNIALNVKQKKLLILLAGGIFAGFLAAVMVGQIQSWQKAKVKVFVAKQGVASWTALREPARLFDV